MKAWKCLSCDDVYDYEFLICENCGHSEYLEMEVKTNDY